MIYAFLGVAVLGAAFLVYGFLLWQSLPEVGTWYYQVQEVTLYPAEKTLVMRVASQRSLEDPNSLNPATRYTDANVRESPFTALLVRNLPDSFVMEMLANRQPDDCHMITIDSELSGRLALTVRIVQEDAYYGKPRHTFFLDNLPADSFTGSKAPASLNENNKVVLSDPHKSRVCRNQVRTLEPARHEHFLD